MRAPVLAIVLALSAGLPGVARAAWMPHYDLTGLVLQSNAVVVADRGASTTTGYVTATTYTVTRVVRGSGLAVGATVSLDDGLYVTTGHHVDRSVVLFLAQRDGVWGLVGSGMRVVEGGRVFRFEQGSNPGPYVMVPQGMDPADVRGVGRPDARVTLDGFFAALTAATRRADAFAAASRLGGAARRAALLALLGPVFGSGNERTIGFYVDHSARHAERVLCDGGDLVGALEASAHDASQVPEELSCTEPPAATVLLAVAQDVHATLAVRVGAVRALRDASGLCDDEATPRAVAALLADPSAQIRAAAAGALVSTVGVTGSEAADRARYRRIGARSRAALRAAWDTETNGEVLHAIGEALTGDDSRLRLGAPRHGPPLIMHVAMAQGVVWADGYAATRGRMTGMRMLAATPAGPVEVPATIDVARLAGGDGLGGGGTVQTWPAAGRYPLTMELTLAGAAPLTAPVGTLVVDAHGVASVEPLP